MKVIDQQTFSSYKKTGMQKLEHIPLLLTRRYIKFKYCPW